MQITPKILSIPPYLSTTWDTIAALKSEPNNGAYSLIITLKTGDSITVPSLSEEEITTILEAHAQYLQPIAPFQGLGQGLGFPVPFSFSLPLKQDGGPVASLGDSMRHNPEQSDLPDIPVEILGRVTMIAKAFGLDDFSALEEAVDGCNCTYCQLKRAFVSTLEIGEEKIKDEDLHFRDWEVSEISDKLFTVTSPLDKNEQYNVFLGEPLGCTCGNKNCEHIKAVLRS